jgi:glycosyl hydrolase family 2
MPVCAACRARVVRASASRSRRWAFEPISAHAPAAASRPVRSEAGQSTSRAMLRVVHPALAGLGVAASIACSTIDPVRPLPAPGSNTPVGDVAGDDAGQSTPPGPDGERPSDLAPGSGGTSSTPADGGAPPLDAALARGVQLSAGQLFVDGAPFYIRGVCYNPVPRGATHPAGVDFAGLTPLDIPLLAQAGVNVIRTYVPLTDVAVLDALYAAGIRVIDGIFVAGDTTTDAVVSSVNALKDHPAILMWSLGNEWNYNGLYVGLSLEDARARINEVAAALRAADPSHPIATLYGELPTADTVLAMPDIDVWGINAYRGITFGMLFSDWAALSDKPMFVSEYGADAYNSTTGMYDPASQALAVGDLTREIRAAGGRVLGGTLFEWADEWWKVSGGSPSVQEVGGTAPGGGPYPDGTFNEEWWGLVDIDRTPRAAYQSLSDALAE